MSVDIDKLIAGHVVHLQKRIDGLEAAVGELRALLRHVVSAGRFECTCGWTEPAVFPIGAEAVCRKCPACQGVAVFLQRGGNG